MMKMGTINPPPSLHVARLPGELGPVVRCSGELTLRTAEILNRELDLLISLGHPALILNLTGCRFIDVDGLLLILDTYRRLRETGQRLAVVAGSDPAARILHGAGVDWMFPVVPTEDSARLVLKGAEPPPPGPGNWEQARAGSVAAWKAIRDMLDTVPAEEVIRRVTGPHDLCRRAEDEVHAPGGQDTTRCYVCPLFHALGGESEDVGCRRATQPMIEALLSGDRWAARTQVSRLIELMERMPVPLD